MNVGSCKLVKFNGNCGIWNGSWSDEITWARLLIKLSTGASNELSESNENDVGKDDGKVELLCWSEFSFKWKKN